MSGMSRPVAYTVDTHQRGFERSGFLRRTHGLRGTLGLGLGDIRGDLVDASVWPVRVETGGSSQHRAGSSVHSISSMLLFLLV